ncbi:MAG TPA: hypothetical protein VFH61_08350 [Thermoleophilia bacterium]|nr:hypothetical protein [Thermoleophilia bacterium]
MSKPKKPKGFFEQCSERSERYLVPAAMSGFRRTAFCDKCNAQLVFINVRLDPGPDRDFSPGSREVKLDMRTYKEGTGRDLGTAVEHALLCGLDESK